MNGTEDTYRKDPAEDTLAGRVRAVLLDAGFNGTDGGLMGMRFRITDGVGVTVGTESAGDVPESIRRAMLGRYAARLAEAGMTVSDRSERGYIYVHEEGREADPVKTVASNPDIQYFASSGTWVKPSGAVRVDIVLRGGGAGNSAPRDGITGECGGSSSAYLGRRVNPNGIKSSNGEPGDIRVSSWDADDLDDEIEVRVGKGGRPGGRDGYALIVTHLSEDGKPEL